MANPPILPNGFTATTPNDPVTYGVIIHYGVDDIAVAGIIVDSYKRDAKYAKVDEIIGKNGIVEGVRMSDYRVEISVSGRVVESAGGTGYTAGFTYKVGDVLNIPSTGDKGVITSISLSASGTGFTTVDCSATCYEGISTLAPA